MDVYDSSESVSHELMRVGDALEREKDELSGLMDMLRTDYTKQTHVLAQLRAILERVKDQVSPM